LNCSQEETLHHLVLTCTFANACWDHICQERTKDLSVMEAFADLREKLNVPFFMEIIFFWLRGAFGLLGITTFSKIQIQQLQAGGAVYFQEIRMVKHRMKKKYSTQFCNWFQEQNL
jgi:hypothetical protein